MDSKPSWLSFLGGFSAKDGHALVQNQQDEDAVPSEDHSLAAVKKQFFKAVDLGDLEELYFTLSRPNVNSMSLLFAVSEVTEYRTCMDLVISKSGQEHIRETPLAAWYLKNAGKSEGVLTPLHIAARNGHTDMVTLLLQHLTANVGRNQLNVIASYLNKTSCGPEALTPLHLAVYAPLKRDSNTPQHDSTSAARKLMEDLMVLNNCFGDRIGCIEALISNGARVNLKAEVPGLYGSRGTALHMACVAFCDPETIEVLLEGGADVHADITSEDPNLNNANAMHLAVRVGLLYEDSNVLPALRLLLAAGSDPFSEALEGTPLHLACKYGFGDLACLVIQLLADAMVSASKERSERYQRSGARPGPRSEAPRPMTISEILSMKGGGYTPLQYAAMNCESEEEVVECLLSMGADCSGEVGAAALLLAMQYEDVDLVKTKWLLEMGASTDVAVEVEEGLCRRLTPVQWVFHAIAGMVKCEQAREVMLEVFKVILEYHQELPLIPTDATGTVLASPMLFALRHFDLEFLGTMLVAGDDLNEVHEVSGPQGKRRHNPLMAVLEREDLEEPEGLLALLVQAGADATVRSELYNGGGPFHMLANGMESLVVFIAGLGLDINSLDDNMDTPLAVACQKGQMHVARMLMMQAAKVDTHNKQGRTPLHLVCLVPQSSQHLSMARSLLKAGADPTAKDLDGRTPLDYAKQAGCSDTISLLEKFRRLKDAQARAAMDRKLSNPNPDPSTLLAQLIQNMGKSPPSPPPATPTTPGLSSPSPIVRHGSTASSLPPSTPTYQPRFSSSFVGNGPTSWPSGFSDPHTPTHPYSPTSLPATPA